MPSHVGTVFIPTRIVWFSSSPGWEIPKTVVRPLPIALLRLVVGSYPDVVYTFSVHPLHDICFDGIRGDRCQMRVTDDAPVLSINPGVPHGGEPKVAVVSILLPALVARLGCWVPAWADCCASSMLSQVATSKSALRLNSKLQWNLENVHYMKSEEIIH